MKRLGALTMADRICRCLSAVFLFYLYLPATVASQEAVPILIGASVSHSSDHVDISEMAQKGLLLWEEQVNRRGGVLGRPVKLVLYDDESDVEKVASIYTRLIEYDHCDFLIAPYSTPLTLSAAEITESAGRILMVAGAGGAQIWERGYRRVYGMYAPADRYFIGLLDLIARRGINRLGIVYDNTSYHRTILDGVVRWADIMGVTIVTEYGYYDLDAQLDEILSGVSRPDTQCLILSSYIADTYDLLAEISRRGVRPRVLSVPIAGIQPDFARIAGSIAEGVFAPSQWEPHERTPYPGAADFIKAFRIRFGHDPTYHAASSFAACRIIERAVLAAGTTEQRAVAELIHSFDVVTEFGRFKIDHEGRQIGHNPILIQWQDGTKQIVYPAAIQTAKPRFDN